MNRNVLRKIHGTAAAIATLCIFCFWTSTLLSELFFSQSAVTAVKQTILYAFVLFVPCMAITGATGMKMGGKSQFSPIAAKRKRMPIIAANGLLILLPAAFFLADRAARGEFDAVFYTVQMAELAAGAVNFMLMCLSMKDGLSIRKRKNS